MKSTETKTTQREKRKAGLSALLRDDVEEITNESLPTVIHEISENEKEKEISNEVRVTLQMEKEIHKKVKIMAHWELTTLKDIVNSSLEKTISEYEKTHG